MKPVFPLRSVLMVVFHFPPQSGSSGLLRSLNFVRHLPVHDWHPVVLSANPMAYESVSDDLLQDIPGDVQVFRTWALDAARHLALSGRYLRTTALPDRWSSWWLSAIWAGRTLIRRHRPSLIWSTYPIGTAHLIGATLARWSGIPWVADFRDPMMFPGQNADRWQRGIWGWIERQAMTKAAACVFTTSRSVNAHVERYPEAASRCHVIANGYDESAFASATPMRYGAPNDRLLLLHSGLIYPVHRDPSAFFAAVARLLESGRIERSRLCIRFRAPKHDAEVRAAAERHGVADVLEIAAPLPYREALGEMMAADLLLLFQGSGFNAQIPAKVYEYLRSGRPMMSLGDEAGDVHELLQVFEGLWRVPMSDEKAIALALGDWLDAQSTEALSEALGRNRVRIAAYSREAQAAELARLFDSLTHLKPHADQPFAKERRHVDH